MRLLLVTLVLAFSGTVAHADGFIEVPSQPPEPVYIPDMVDDDQYTSNTTVVQQQQSNIEINIFIDGVPQDDSCYQCGPPPPPVCHTCPAVLPYPPQPRGFQCAATYDVYTQYWEIYQIDGYGRTRRVAFNYGREYFNMASTALVNQGDCINYVH